MSRLPGGSSMPAPTSTPTDSTGDTLLMAAVRAGGRVLVQLLVERGAEVNASEPDLGHTALMYTVGRTTAGLVQPVARDAAQRLRRATRVGAKPAVRPPGRVAVRTVLASSAVACPRRASSCRRPAV